MSDVAAHGPIDYIVVEFEGDGLQGASAAAVQDLVERGVVALYDVLVLTKDPAGAVRVVDLEHEGAGGFEGLAGARSGLLDDEDARDAGEVLRPGTTGVVLVYENTWAAPFVAAALREGGTPVASARVPALDVMAALDGLDAAGS